MTFIIVTPIHNEKDNIAALARQLTASSTHPDYWVVVDDGSTDHGAREINPGALPFKTAIIKRENGGGLIGGSAFTAWQFGVDFAIEQMPDFDFVMKLDADVDVSTDYLAQMLSSAGDTPTLGLVGGALIGSRDREQTIHVPGPVKLYTRRGYLALENLPRVVGFDVMDELAIKAAGLRVLVRRDVHFTVRRAIGASQGLIHGRRRNGLVCNWTGYWPPYFVLHAIRYIFRSPFVVGSFAMLVGYVRAPESPYPKNLRDMHTAEQRSKLRAAIRSPFSWVRETYGLDAK